MWAKLCAREGNSPDRPLRPPSCLLYTSRIETANTHGTGCTLSSAIACGLARGLPLTEAVRAAKDYVSGALAAGLDLGRGSGPLDHGYLVRR